MVQAGRRSNKENKGFLTSLTGFPGLVIPIGFNKPSTRAKVGGGTCHGGYRIVGQEIGRLGYLHRLRKVIGGW